MNPERWKQIDAILSAALQREEGQRASFLARAREGDEELQKQVQALVLAAIEVKVGDMDSAIEHIGQLLSIPCMLSPDLLRIDPVWAPLRSDPRFRQLAGIEGESRRDDRR